MTHVAGAMVTPPLPPELWNFAMIVLLCGLVGWLMRLTQLVLTLVDVRFAVQSNAILHLRDLGPSLSVLESANARHLEQLSRTKVQVVSTKMASVRLAFEVLAASLAVSQVAASDTTTTSSTTTNTRAQHKPPHLQLSFKVRASAKCIVQVLWGVQTDALLADDVCAHRLASPRSRSSSAPKPVLQRLSSQKKSVQQRVAAELPTFLSRGRRQHRRHRLTDDDDHKEDTSSKDDAAARDHTASSTGISLEHIVRDDSFESTSPSVRFDACGEHDVVVEMPRSCYADLADEIQSLLAETTKSDVPTTTAAVPSPTGNSVERVPRFSAVVVVGALEFFDEASLLPPKALASGASNNTVVCQCVAIDLLPTPVRAEKFTPVVVKHFTVTLTGVYAQQEVFGCHDTAGECVICLEGELAVVLLPCRHLCVCRTCLREIDRCPICRATFSTYACFAEDDVKSNARDPNDAKKCVELKIV